MTIETKTTKVLIVDDERLFAELLRVALRNADGIEVVDVVHDVQTAVRRICTTARAMSPARRACGSNRGADIARTVRATLPDTSVLILTGDPSVSVLSDVARSGAVGHLTKDRPFDEVVDGVRAAALGEILFAPSELQRLLLERESRPRPLEPLTARELEVLQLLAEGSSTGQASEQLGISSATLRAHVQAILRKLGAHSRLEAVAEAARLGVITLDAWSRDKAAPRQKEVE